ncbi:MAG: VOC family protein [Promethearchaeota archaeon]|nr:MAG: VOC family protein [Candidatus Lokiarchaeota archaeon]
MSKLNHIALISHSEAESDKFYVDLLGLEKKYTFNVNSKLMNSIFGINKEMKVVRYGNDNYDLEIFITEDLKVDENSISHIGITVEDKEEFLKKSQSLGFRVNKILKKDEDTYYLFVRDASGNYFEIKE